MEGEQGQIPATGGRTARVQNKRASQILRCPSAPLAWLPQHSRRPAVIKPAASASLIASAVPGQFSQEFAGKCGAEPFASISAVFNSVTAITDLRVAPYAGSV